MPGTRCVNLRDFPKTPMATTAPPQDPTMVSEKDAKNLPEHRIKIPGIETEQSELSHAQGWSRFQRTTAVRLIMRRGPGASKGVGKTTGLIGTGLRRAILTRTRKPMRPRREPAKGWNPLRDRNQENHGAETIIWKRTGYIAFSGSATAGCGVGSSGLRTGPAAENHTGD